MKTILVNLIGGQTIPNIIAQKYVNPDKVILIFSKDSAKQKEYYKEASVNMLFEEIEIDPYNYESIYQSIKDIIAVNIQEDLVLNFTSGTKIMSLASFDAFNNSNLLSIYINSEQNNVYKYKNGNSELEKMNINITAEEYLKLNGHIFKIDDVYIEDDARKKYYEYMEFNYNEDCRKFLDMLNRNYEKNKSAFYKSEYNVAEDKFEYRWDNKRKSSIIKINGCEFEILGKDSVKYISGMWFEDLVFNKKFSGNNIYEEIRRNVHIKDKRGRQDMIELDIIGLVKGNLHLFELKSGKPRREALNNLRTIKEQLGTYTKLFLISYFSLLDDDPLIERMKDLGIKCFNYHDFELAKCIEKSNINL